MVSVFLFAKAAEEALFHTEAVSADMASHSPKTAAADNRHCTVAGAGAVEVAVYGHNMPHHGPAVKHTAGKLL